MASPRRGSKLAMPILIINLGIEMIYVLEQRLRAQSVPVEKSRQVLTEVIHSLLTPTFLKDIFQPQNPHTYKSLRSLFSHLAHSSIMRLNESSMAKLYDLMVMAFKFQTLACGHPARVALDVSFKHLAVLRSILVARGSATATATSSSTSATAAAVAAAAAAPPASAPGSSASEGQAQEAGAVEGLLAAAAAAATGTVADLIDAVQRSLQAIYGDLPPGEQWALYSALLNFLIDRRIKVSALIADGFQTMEGALVLGCSGNAAPRAAAAAAVGTLRRFDPGTGKCVATEDIAGLKQTHSAAAAALAAMPGGGGKVDWRELGSNLYGDVRWSSSSVARASPARGSSSSSSSSSSAVGAGAGEAAQSGGGKAGLDFLSSLLQGASAGTPEGYNLDLGDLLGEGGDDSSGEGGWGSSGSSSSSSSTGGVLPSAAAGSDGWGGAPSQQVVRIAAAVSGSTRGLSSSVAESLGGGGQSRSSSSSSSSKEEEGGDSLLDLMDSL